MGFKNNTIKKLFCNLSLFYLSFLAANSQSFQWANWVGKNTNVLFSNSYSSFTEPNGNSYLLGSFEDTLDTQSSIMVNSIDSNGIFLIKYDPNGNILWAKNIAYGFNIVSRFNQSNIDVDQAGYIYICGSFMGPLFINTTIYYTAGNYDYFIAKLDPNGNFVYSRQFSHGYLGQINLSLDSHSNINVFGEYHQSINLVDTILTSSYTALFFAKYDSSGNLLTAKSIVQQTVINTFGASVKDIKTDASGNSLLLFSHIGACLLDTINITPGSANSYDNIILKVDFNGNLIWFKTLYASVVGHSVFCQRVTVGNDLNVYATGSFTGSFSMDSDSLTSSGGSDMFVLKLDSNGNKTWIRNYGGSGFGGVFGMCITVTNQNELYVGGNFYTPCSIDTFNLAGFGMADLFLSHLDLNGNPLWIKELGSSKNESLTNTKCDAQGNIYLFGEFDSVCNFENITISSSYLFKYFASKLSLITSVNECISDKSNFSVAPNPAYDFITINYDLSSSKKTTFYLYNQYGQTLKTISFAKESSGINQFTMELNGLSAGVYFAKLLSGNKTEIKKIVKL